MTPKKLKSKLLILAAFTISFFLFSAPKSAHATLDLEVPLEMVDYGLNSQTSTTTFARTGMYMDKANYEDDNDTNDSATYYFEVVAENNYGNNLPIYLRDITGGQDVASLTSGNFNGGSPNRVRSESWTPGSGKREYRVKVGPSGGEGDVTVHSARIIVEQHNATKTRIQIPLVQRSFNASAGTGGNVDSTVFIDYDYEMENPQYYSYWRKNTSVFADLASTNPWTLEGVIDSTVGNEYYTTVGLLDATTNGVVAEIATNSTNPDLKETSFPNDAANFTEGRDFRIKMKTTPYGAIAELRSAARLYVRLENLRKAEVYYRVARYFADGTGAKIADEQRVLLDKTKFSNPAIFFEASGYCADTNNAHLFLADDGINDYGTSGSNIAESGINFSSGTKAIQRSGDITSYISGNSGNNAHRFYGASTSSNPNDLEISHAWLVVQARPLILRWDGYLKFFGTLKFL
jgi:hypothetical protein